MDTEPSSRDVMAFTIGFDVAKQFFDKSPHDEWMGDEKFMCHFMQIDWNEYLLWRKKLRDKTTRNNEHFLKLAQRIMDLKFPNGR